MSVAMVGSMFMGIGTKEVNAATYKSGTLNPKNLKVGDVLYKGVQLNPNYYAVLCEQCNMVWLTDSTSVSVGDNKNAEVKN